jgi:uncharacterized repeat protein (TIGR03803 family)
MIGKSSFRKRSATQLLVLGVLLGAAWAQTESVLYSFCAQNNCTDGSNPEAGLAFDKKGNLYGTTAYGGAYGGEEGFGGGVVFKLTPEGEETVLHSFCAQRNCTDGYYPFAGLVFDQKGNMYGTTAYGGTYNGGCTPEGCGVVFKLTPDGEETVLYSFCAQYNCVDGAGPLAGLVLDSKGNLYGTTLSGGTYGYGTVFKVTPEGGETVLHSFCAPDGNRCTDGAWPSAGLIFDRKGNLYGTTQNGGTYTGFCNEGVGCGVVFKLTPKGKETVLYSFCAKGGSNCTDGAGPFAGLVFDPEGNLYGTTAGGGAYSKGYSGYGIFKETPKGYSGYGVVFKVTPKGKETVLYAFCSQGYCTDGDGPSAGLTLDETGNFYGTTVAGGAYNGGVVFKLTPKGNETVLYSFCAQGYACADGKYPYAGLVFDQNGNLYGTTEGGGAGKGGVVFKLTP